MLPEIRSSAEVYGSLVDGPLKGTPISGVSLVEPNKKISVFRVAQPYLSLLAKPRFFSGFLKKHIILCILKGKMPYKMHKIISFSRKKNN